MGLWKRDSAEILHDYHKRKQIARGCWTTSCVHQEPTDSASHCKHWMSQPISRIIDRSGSKSKSPVRRTLTGRRKLPTSSFVAYAASRHRHLTKHGTT
eukprot:8025638-Karenia_brevis.AAC.1